MKLGMFLRAENTGLSRMSLDAYTNLHPDACLVIDVDHPSPMHLDRFPDAYVVNPKKTAEFEVAVKHLLHSVDTLLVLETPYNPNVYQWARQAGVYTVCVAMPEYDIPWRWQADLVVNPSNYLHHRLPDSAIVFPWPVDLTTITYRPRTSISKWLHIVGQPCSQDRNGTQLVMDAFDFTKQKLLVRSQVPLPARRRSDIELAIGNVESVSDLYQDGDAFICPRRYAGQSLPMNEAQAAGLPLICLNREPERDWTTATIPARIEKEWRVARRSRYDIGPRDSSVSGLDIYTAKVEDIVTVIDAISTDNELVAELSRQSRARAESVSWQTLGDQWRRLLTPYGQADLS